MMQVGTQRSSLQCLFLSLPALVPEIGMLAAALPNAFVAGGNLNFPALFVASDWSAWTVN